jgi:hypothetical protein
MGIPSTFHRHSISITGLNPSAQLVEALDGMNKKFANPYIIFFPIVSRDGMPFPINKSVCEMQRGRFSEETAWRGNLVIAKYRDNPWTSLLDVNIADYWLLRNYLTTHSPDHPAKVCLSFSFAVLPTAPNGAKQGGFVTYATIVATHFISRNEFSSLLVSMEICQLLYISFSFFG